MRIGLIISLIAIMQICCCIGFGMNTNPAEYIDHISLTEAGSNAIVVNVALGDNKGDQTQDTGIANVLISQRGEMLYNNSIEVNDTSFSQRLGGPLAQLGRLKLDEAPVCNSNYDNPVEVYVTYVTSDGRKLDGEKEEMYWDC
jgi:hypothetical protein